MQAEKRDNMKRIFTLLLLALLIFGGVRITAQEKTEAKTSNDEYVEAYQDPYSHLVFENKDLKIIDVQMEPGDTTLFHWHRDPLFQVSLGWQKCATQSPDANWIQSFYEVWPIGGIATNISYLDQPIVHRLTNLGTKTSRVIAILNTGKGLTTSDKSSGYALSNRWFRSKRMNLIPGDTINIQNPEFPVVMVLVSGDEIEVVKDNKNMVHKKKWLYIDEPCKLINPGNNKMEIIQIEVLN